MADDTPMALDEAAAILGKESRRAHALLALAEAASAAKNARDMQRQAEGLLAQAHEELEKEHALLAAVKQDIAKANARRKIAEDRAAEAEGMIAVREKTAKDKVDAEIAARRDAEERDRALHNQTMASWRAEEKELAGRLQELRNELARQVAELTERFSPPEGR